MTALAAPWPVLVASRSRSGAALLAELAAQSARPWRVYVEPQEAAEYAAQLPAPNVYALPLGGQGLPYVRQHILERRTTDKARLARQPWFWLLDDDIAGWYRASGGKCHKATMEEILAEAEARVTRLAAAASGGNFAQVAFEYQQYAWANRTPGWTWDSYADVAVGINAARCGLARFRPRTDLKCDRDFTLQLLASGRRVGRFKDLAFSAPKNGSNAGGLAESYAEDGREAAASRAMAELWGDRICLPVTKPDGRPDVKINWRLAAGRDGRA